MPMKRHLLYLVLAVPILGTAAPLQCDIGPITKVFGSVPFYFMFSPEGRGYHLRGEGTGSKDLTDAALKELQALSDKDIVGLVGQTIAMRNGAAKR
jgi:hypothetical protein